MKIKTLYIGITALVFGLGTATVNADIIQIFQTDSTFGGPISPADTLTVTLTGLSDGGVTFDAVLTVLGSGDLNYGSTGLGVTGNTSSLVDTGEFLRFSLTTINEVGGSVLFNGFTEVDYNSFGATDAGVLSVDSDESTLPDNFFTTTVGGGNVDISATSPTVFHAIADSGAANTFRIDDVSASFTGTAVPEPSSLALLSLGVLVLFSARRKK